MVGFLGFKVPEEDGNRISRVQPIAPGTGPYAFVSNRAVFVHKAYLKSLFVGIESEDCCEISLSLRVSAAFGKAPVVVKATVVDLLEESPVRRGSHHRIGVCSDECLPSWLQVSDLNALPHEHTAFLG